jgi:hypothetical protein
MTSAAPSRLVSAPRDPVRRGDVVAGKYAVEEVLGRGGNGVVVAARHSPSARRWR